MNIELTAPSAKRVTRILLTVVAVLVVVSVLGQTSKHLFGHPRLKGLVPAFYVDFESNVPTWYSSFALGLAGGLAALIAAAETCRRARYRRHWTALAVILFGLSMDEVAMLHEYPIEPMRQMLQVGGLLHYPWVILGGVFVAVVGISFCGFLRHLPAPTRWLFLLAGATFVGGAIGVEMLSGLQADRFGEENFAYAMIVTAEETLEMLGVVILIHALWGYLTATIGAISVRFTPAAGPQKRRVPRPSAPADRNETGIEALQPVC